MVLRTEQRKIYIAWRTEAIYPLGTFQRIVDKMIFAKVCTTTRSFMNMSLDASKIGTWECDKHEFYLAAVQTIRFISERDVPLLPSPPHYQRIRVAELEE